MRETERVMDVELFFKGQARWERYSPYHLAMMYEMFKHATDEGQKQAKQTVCQGHQEGLPKLDPETDLSTILLVSPETTKEEILSLY